jgi:hypothetical protein
VLVHCLSGDAKMGGGYAADLLRIFPDILDNELSDLFAARPDPRLTPLSSHIVNCCVLVFSTHTPLLSTLYSHFVNHGYAFVNRL